MKLGFIGTGTITASIVHGLGAEFAEEGRIRVSPRGEEMARSLADTFAHVTIAVSNQDVLDHSDIVILAVRPQIADAVIGDLRFRPDHHVISLVATFSRALLTRLVAPAAQLTKAVPLPSVAIGRGPTAIYPHDPVAAALFNRVGTATEVDEADAFDALTAVTATMASYFDFAGSIANWLAQHGLPASEARRYVRAVFEGLALTTRHSHELDFAELARDHATQGGINEQLARVLTERGVFTEIQAGLDGILARIQGRPNA